MSTFLLTAIITYLIALLLTAGVMPFVIRSAVRHNRFDMPGLRKIHHCMVPRLGGVAFIPAAVITTFVVVGFVIRFGCGQIICITPAQASQLILGGAALALVYTTGLIDDIIGINYRIKLIIQIAAACLMVASGLPVDKMGGLFGIYNLSPWIGYPLAVVFTVAMLNSMNLIDGLDGLCSGLALITFISYALVLNLCGNIILTLLTVAVLGALTGFFFYNVAGNPQRRTKIFMGDTGSLSLGMIIATCALSIVDSYPATNATEQSRLVLFVMTPLLIPCMDMARVFLWRIRHHHNPFLADQNHIHHRLLALGLSQRGVLLVIFTADVALCAANYFLAPVADINIIVCSEIVLWILANILIAGRARHQSKVTVSD